MMMSDYRATPVRVYRSHERFMIAAPMPGLEAADISISIRPRLVVLRGQARGPHQHERDLLAEEWQTGPYYREVEAPAPLDGPLANATYGNGVLVVSIPWAHGNGASSVDFQLRAVGTTRGERVGHHGLSAVPASTGASGNRLR